MIHIYKPNRNNTGAAISFQASERDGSLYVNMIRQHSWNDETKKGSFKQNRNHPTLSTALKFNQLEAAQMIDVVERFYEWKTYHGIPTRGSTIVFGPGEGDSCFLFKVSQTNKEDPNQKASFFISISFGEARLIKEYLIHYLHKSFRFNVQKAAAKGNELEDEVSAQPDATPVPEEDTQVPVQENNTDTGAAVQHTNNDDF